jgi:hypothetical protein
MDGELGGQYTSNSTRSGWGCRKCNLLRYASEGGALLVRPRGTLGLMFGIVHSPRPESWFPYVFTSPKETAEGSEVAIEDVPELNNCQDVINSTPKLMRDEKDTEDAPKEGANQQAIPREVEIQREIQAIPDNMQKYQRHLELTANRTNSIAFTIPRRRFQ